MGNSRSAVVLVFDRLRAGFLGPYGGTWCETPAANRLAAAGYLAEQAWADSPSLDWVYRSYWSGRHAACRSVPDACDLQTPLPAGLALAERLAAAGRYAELLTDDPTVASHRWGEAFAERMVLHHEGPAEAAESAGAMRVAQLLAEAAERLEALPDGSLLWVHAAAWNDAWDAPWEFRAELADEEDPAPPDFVDPPLRSWTGAGDPDERLGYLQAYAGQVAAWDACLDAWMAAFESSRAGEDALLIVTSPRGYPLGEHGAVGDDGAEGIAAGLHSELLQTPLFLRHPRASRPMLRDQRLWQPPDLYSTLVDWFELPASTAAVWGESTLPRARGEATANRAWAASVAGARFALRTPEWLLVGEETPDAGEAHPTGLYLKPDDRWEANEVSARCGETVESLLGCWPALRTALDDSRPDQAPAAVG